ncbi:alpha-L-rhamnosidase N-terminal domain-containing protein [uncultured Microbacterium sp.]|uniref:alpha-L-rhamnosidase N-terminal domain-containing protein n=1 Tax=uncultured Microbacterium sp. TaxID=191216 RepID=UPI003459B1C4
MGLTGSSAQFGTRTSAIWQLHLDYADGPDEIIASGDDVRSARGGWDYADLFVGERFDRRAETPGWDWLRDSSGPSPTLSIAAERSAARTAPVSTSVCASPFIGSPQSPGVPQPHSDHRRACGTRRAPGPAGGKGRVRPGRFGSDRA